jgi:hypothetical protein
VGEQKVNVRKMNSTGNDVAIEVEENLFGQFLNKATWIISNTNVTKSYE